MSRLFRFLSRESAVRKLRKSAAENARLDEERQRRLEEQEALFDSLSDSVFFFRGAELARANPEGRRLLASAADPAELAKALRYARPGPAPSPADWLVPRDGKGTPLLLRIRKSLPVRLRDGPGRLVTVEDLSPLRRLAEEADAHSARERRQIGRDLHDGLSQLLTFLSVGSKALEIEASRAGIETASFERIARRAQECVETAAKLTRRFD
jgi:signal transduction histidine kinase